MKTASQILKIYDNIIMPKHFTIKLPPRQEEKNQVYKSIGTKECLKCIKKPKKVSLEDIFIKTKSTKK